MCSIARSVKRAWSAMRNHSHSRGQVPGGRDPGLRRTASVALHDDLARTGCAPLATPRRPYRARDRRRTGLVERRGALEVLRLAGPRRTGRRRGRHHPGGRGLGRPLRLPQPGPPRGRRPGAGAREPAAGGRGARAPRSTTWCSAEQVHGTRASGRDRRRPRPRHPYDRPTRSPATDALVTADPGSRPRRSSWPTASPVVLFDPERAGPRLRARRLARRPRGRAGGDHRRDARARRAHRADRGGHRPGRRRRTATRSGAEVAEARATAALGETGPAGPARRHGALAGSTCAGDRCGACSGARRRRRPHRRGALAPGRAGPSSATAPGGRAAASGCWPGSRRDRRPLPLRGLRDRSARGRSSAATRSGRTTSSRRSTFEPGQLVDARPSTAARLVFLLAGVSYYKTAGSAGRRLRHDRAAATPRSDCSRTSTATASASSPTATGSTSRRLELRCAGSATRPPTPTAPAPAARSCPSAAASTRS